MRKDFVFSKIARFKVLAGFALAASLLIAGCNKEMEDNFGVGASDYQAAVPTICPPPGLVSSGTTVHLATTTDDAAIWYTTDNSEPAEGKGTKFSGGIIIAGEIGDVITVRAIAVKSGLTDSPKAEFAYTISGETSGAIDLTSHEVSGGGARYDTNTHLYTISVDGVYTVTGSTTEDAIEVEENLSNVRITLDDVSIVRGGNVPPLKIGSNSVVILLIKGSNLLKTTGNYSSAINIENASGGTTLIIDSAESDNPGDPTLSSHKISGVLRAAANESNSLGAAIGGDGITGSSGSPASAGSGGNITILGATIAAYAYGGAGIGGGAGSSDYDTGGAGGNVRIDGGFVFAGSQRSSAGIGGGYGGANGGGGGALTINGGAVLAFSNYDSGAYGAAGIGGGNKGSGSGNAGAGGTIAVTGGTVFAASTNGYGIGCGVSEGDGSGGAQPDFTGTNFNTAVAFISSISLLSAPPGTGIFIDSGDFTYELPTWNDTFNTFNENDGEITLQKNYTVPAGGTLIVPRGLVIHLNSKTITNNGIVCYYRPKSSPWEANGETVSGEEYGWINDISTK